MRAITLTQIKQLTSWCTLKGYEVKSRGVDGYPESVYMEILNNDSKLMILYDSKGDDVADVILLHLVIYDYATNDSKTIVNPHWESVQRRFA